MSHCERFEQEGLLILEQGGSLGRHFSECDDCRKSWHAYETIKKELGTMHQHLKAPSGWQDKVWQTIALREQGKRGRWKWALAPLAAAAAGAFLIFGSLLPEDTPVSIDVSLQPSDAVTRGLNARPGDELVINAAVGDAAIAEILVYRNDSELVFRCSDQLSCTRRGKRISARFELGGIGNYQPILILSDSAIPQLTNQLDEDARIVLESGAKVELSEPISVY